MPYPFLMDNVCVCARVWPGKWMPVYVNLGTIHAYVVALVWHLVHFHVTLHVTFRI